MFPWNEFAYVGAFVSACVGGVIWINKQFSYTNNLVWKKFDELKNTFLDKLEYHERHDDVRFDNIRKDIYQIGLKMAAKTGEVNGKECQGRN